VTVSADPEPLGGWRGAVGRPLALELLHPLERRFLEREPVEPHRLPPGDGRAIVLVPGFGAHPRAFDLLAAWLERAGWEPVPAPVGRNVGPSEPAVEAILDAVDLAADRTGRPVFLVGHSRGGQQARVAVVRRPDRIAGLITLGAPHLVDTPANLAVRLPVQVARYRVRRGGEDPDELERAYTADRARPFPAQVPFVSIWTRLDGVVDWRSCFDPAALTLEVRATHRGLRASVASFAAIADALHHIGAQAR
jgi:pimeloyl-ACP methyl ester carboxylesterase